MAKKIVYDIPKREIGLCIYVNTKKEQFLVTRNTITEAYTLYKIIDQTGKVEKLKTNQTPADYSDYIYGHKQMHKSKQSDEIQAVESKTDELKPKQVVTKKSVNEKIKTSKNNTRKSFI